MLYIHYCTWTLRQERSAGTSLTVTDQSFIKQNMFLGKHKVSWFWFGFRTRCHVISRMNAVFRMWLNCPERFSSSPSEYNEVIIGLICFFCSVKQMCGSSAACQCPAGPDYCPRDAFRAHGKHPAPHLRFRLSRFMPWKGIFTILTSREKVSFLKKLISCFVYELCFAVNTR